MSKILAYSGYMAPEYALHGQFSVKSDIFSFGVLILEIVSGLKNSGIRHGENVEGLLSFVSFLFSLLHLYYCQKYDLEGYVFLIINIEMGWSVNLIPNLTESAIDQILAGMEKLEGGDSYKYCRSINIKQQFTKWNDEMHPYWFTLCSRKFSWQTNHVFCCIDA